MPNNPTSPLSLAAALVLVVSASLFAQESARTSQANKDVDGDVQTAEVVIDGETLFSVRGVKAHTAERRAQQIDGGRVTGRRHRPGRHLRLVSHEEVV